MDTDKLTDTQTKKFPSYFPPHVPPENAKEENIRVYRACKTRKLDKISFTPSFEENGHKCPNEDTGNPSVYSLSTYESPKDVKRFVAMNSEYNKPFKIAVGNTLPKYGVVLRAKDKELGRKSKSSHVDWWLYDGVEPYNAFSMIENFTQHLNEWEQAKGGLA